MGRKSRAAGDESNKMAAAFGEYVTSICVGAAPPGDIQDTVMIQQARNTMSNPTGIRIIPPERFPPSYLPGS